MANEHVRVRYREAGMSREAHGTLLSRDRQDGFTLLLSRPLYYISGGVVHQRQAGEQHYVVGEIEEST